MGFHLQKYNNKEFVEGFYQKLYPPHLTAFIRRLGHSGIFIINSFHYSESFINFAP